MMVHSPLAVEVPLTIPRNCYVGRSHARHRPTGGMERRVHGRLVAILS
jgi:hypothetical protein